ncbi:MAG: anti-sigma factor [Terriglobia bacterium]
MNGHPQAEETFDEYALGVLEGGEKQAFESHLKGCPDCTRKLEEARARIALLALGSPQAAPPDAARERLFQQKVRRDLRTESAPPPRRAEFWGWGVPVFAAAAIVLAILTGIFASQNHQLSRRLKSLQAVEQGMLTTQREQKAEMARASAVLGVLTSPDTLKVSLVSAPARPVPQGKAFYNPQKGLVFYAADLPALPAGRIYQLWLIPAQGKPISAGIFAADAKGNGEILLPPLPRGVPAKAFAVTVEPGGGEPQPTGKKVLIGAVS